MWATFVPKVTVYSEFKPTITFTFSVTMLIFILIGAIGYLAKWASLDKQQKYEQYFKQQKYPVAGLILGKGWNWKFDHPSDKHS